jgi:PAS domain-containing protein
LRGGPSPEWYGRPTPDAVQIVEVPSLRTIFANRHAETITARSLGREPTLDVNEFEGEVLHPDGSPYERNEWPIIRATRGEKVADEELIYRLPDGTSMRFRLSAAPVYGPDGDIVAAVAVGRDISKQEPGDSASLERGL